MMHFQISDTNFQRKGKYLLTLLLNLLSTWVLVAQDTQLFQVALNDGKPLTANYLEVKENNVSIKNALTFCQSSDQTVWIGTESDGLLAYRGNHIQHYRFDPGKSGSLPNNSIYDIWEESPGVLWLTTGSGLVKFNRLSDKFLLFAGKGFHVRRGPDQQLYTVVPGKGLHVIDTNRQQILPINQQKIFTATGMPIKGETIGFIHRFTFDKKGVLWALAKTQNLAGIFSFDRNRNHWKFHPPPVAYLPTFKSGEKLQKKWQPNLDVQLLYIDDSGGIWSGGWSWQGLMRFDTRTAQWQQFQFHDQAQDFSYGTVFHIAPLSTDEFWISTYKNGFAFNHRTHTASNYTWLQNQEGKQPFRQTASNFIDHCGNHWVATENGVFKFNTKQTAFQIENNLPVRGEQLTAFYALSANHFLLANAHHPETPELATSITELKNGTFKRLPVYLKKEVIHEFLPNDDGSFYAIGNYFNRFDPKKPGVERTTFDADNHNDIFSSFEFYRTVRWNDSILFSCARTIPEGLCKINLQNRKIIQLKTTSENLSSKAPQDNGITRILRDSYGRIWCSASGGIDIFDPVNETFEHYTSNNANVSFGGRSPRICESANRTFFIASEAGIYQTKALPGSRFAFELLGNMGVCYWIVSDKASHPWIGTPNGVYRIDPRTKSVKLFTEKEGFYWNPLLQPFVLPDGKFLMRDGAVIDPTNLSQNEFKPTPFLTAFLVAGQPYQTDTAIVFKRQIRLQHSENFFSFRFSSNNYVNEEHNAYRYRLIGIDKDWIEARNRTEAFYTALKPGTYAFYVQAANNDGIWGDAKKLMTVTIVPAWYQTIVFKLSVALMLILTGLAFYRQRMMHVQAKLQAEKQKAETRQREAELKTMKAEFEKQLAETEMTALRSQMNPHFIFNCLNSIKLYTMQNDTAAATEYLTKFSRLMRLVLENSRRSCIPLTAELETLQLYIDMEVMRFKKKLSYSIFVAENVDLDFTEIPPLLIQPFVENAIWHGLMHKEEGGDIAVSIAMEGANMLNITVSDNGIGRARAAALRSKTATAQKSFGMKVTTERIALINQLYKTNTTVAIHDLVDPEGCPAGTEVTIKIPLS